MWFYSTAVSDLLYTLLPMTALIGSIAAGRSLGSSLISDLICNITGFTFNVTTRHAVLSILGLSAVRLFAITRPIHFKRVVHSALVKKFLGLAWLLPVLVSVCPFFKGRKYEYSRYVSVCSWSVHELVPDGKIIVWAHLFLVIVPFMVPGIMIIIMYIGIVYTMCKIRRRRKAFTMRRSALQMDSISQSQTDQKNISPDSAALTKSSTGSRTRREGAVEGDGRSKWLKHATFTTVLVMTLFLLCYISYWSICLELLVKYIRHYYLGQQTFMTFNFWLLTKQLEYRDFCYCVIGSFITILLNALINPFIFLLSNNRKLSQTNKEKSIPTIDDNTRGSRTSPKLRVRGVALTCSPRL